jgi:DNA recombination protein RmuC
MDIAAVFLALVTLVAGLIAGWAIARSRSAADASGSAAAAATIGAERDAAIAEVERVRAEQEATRSQLRDAELLAQQAVTRLEQLQRTEEQLKAAEAQLKDTFARLSSEALERNNTQFMALADDRFRQAGRPLTETLGKVETQLREIEKERAGATEALSRQIEFVRKTGDDLRHETAALVSALRKPQARGRWGELQLRRCVEYAGMTDRCDFSEQASVTTSDGTLRPDLVVRLVGGKNIVVDSKVTLAAYLEAHDATVESVREERLEAHARHLRQHVDQLAAKTYWAQFSPTPEFVLLFVPGEAFLAPALDRDPLLLEDALAKGVHIVTPTSLVSTLRTVAYTWQQDALAANAQRVFELGRELYRRLGTMGDHMDKLGRSLTGAVKDYNRTVGSLEKNVLVTARKLNDLEVVETELVERTPIEEPVRPLGAPELVASTEGTRVISLPARLPAADAAAGDSGQDNQGAQGDLAQGDFGRDDDPGAKDDLAHGDFGQGDLLARADDYGLGAVEPSSDEQSARRA